MHDVAIIAWPAIIFFVGLFFGSRTVPYITAITLLLAVLTRILPNAKDFSGYADNGDLVVMLLIITGFSLIGSAIIRSSERSVAALRASEERYRHLYENSPVGLYRTTPDGRIELANPSMVKMMGFSSFAELSARNLNQEGFSPGYERRQFIEMIENAGEIKGLEAIWTRQDGTTIFVRESAALTRDKQGKTLYYDGMIEDISGQKQAEEAIRQELEERKRVEAKIRAALEEKETLLREVHHRVKNNLQVIIALIKMRAGATQDAGMIQFLTELESQAHSMALVYEQLYQSENLAQIGMAQYLRQLTAHVLDTYGRRDAIQCQLDAPLALDVAQATPCGLIVNELFANILKYAFPPGFQGIPSVSIALRQDGGTYHLTVSDNGVGLPPGYDWRTARTMGLRLVNLWATHQLGGTLAVSGNPGTTFAIAFDLVD
jgi:PAS domain S-box-containing protein